MKFRLTPARSVLLIATVLFASITLAHADTYSVENLGSDHGKGILGLTDSGILVTVQNPPLPSPTTYTLFSYLDGTSVQTTVAPNLVYDNGSHCSIPSGFSGASSAVCNNGRIGFGSRSNPNGDPDGVYAGPLSDLTLLSGIGTFDLSFMNNRGDLVWVDGQDELIFLAIDTTPIPTPEPSSLLLLTTGLASFAGALWHRKRMKLTRPNCLS